jgi:cytochrome b6-f complex iron-sulfur subunit
MAVTRRQFLLIALGSTAAAAIGGVLHVVYHYLAPNRGSIRQPPFTLAEADLKPGESKTFSLGGEAGVIIRTISGEVAAFSAVCTHLGCIVQWQKEDQQFHCPCHGGIFAANGEVLKGPPPRPLNRLPISIHNGSIIIGTEGL